MSNNKVAIVTGASSGIGKSLSFLLAEKNYNLVLAARRTQQLELLRQQIENKYQVKVFCVTTDVSKENDCQNLIEQSIQHFNRIDLLINNAGVSMRALFGKLDMSVFHTVMDINFYGTVYCTKYALPYLLDSKGSVVGVISVAGFRGLPGRTAYSASKFAVSGFLETLRTEYLNEGLHVLIAAPGFTQTEIRTKAFTFNGQPQGESPRVEEKMMSADNVASLIINAIEKRKLYLITDMQGKLVRLLTLIFPRWVDKKVLQTFAKEPGSPV